MTIDGMPLNDFAKEVYRNAVEHGIAQDQASFNDCIAECHGELSEALKAKRDNPNAVIMYEVPDGNGVKPEGVLIEFADVILRILSYCGSKDWDIEEAIRRKHKYNQTRPYRHGREL